MKRELLPVLGDFEASRETGRIAHISIVFSKGRMSGVIRKLAEMATAASTADVPIDFYLLNREKSGRENGLIFINFEDTIGKLAGLKMRALKYRYISILIPSQDYKALVLRYSFSDPSMLSFMKQNEGKVFFEHHTNELTEIWRSGMPIVSKMVTYVLEKTIAPIALRRAMGVFAVTSEFLQHQIERARLPKSVATMVLPNGALFSEGEIELRPVKGLVRFAFVADRFRSWHGLSRIVASFREYAGNDQIELLLIGQLEDSQVAEVNELSECNSRVSVVLAGVLSHEELVPLLSSCHIAFDSLATHELGMRESSTLKVKLYLEAGLPWVSATPDADVGHDTTVCMLVPNNSSSLAIEPILDWRKQLGRSEFVGSISHLRESTDWRVKLKLLSTWIDSVLSER